MRVLVMGVTGMLGHKLCQSLRSEFEMCATARRPLPSAVAPLFEGVRVLSPVDAEAIDSAERAVAETAPDAVVNCVGIVKQLPEAGDPARSLAVNALFPHRLERCCRERGVRLIHVSTDCVFSGRKGAYTESDAADAEDLYGRSKLMGEVSGEGCLTLRTSMIGRELFTSHGLLEWFLSQRGRRVRGFRRARFSGLTTLALSEAIARLVADFPSLCGVYHLAADPIDKFTLLRMVRDICKVDVEIEPDEAFVCDRTLDGGRLRRDTGFAAPDWPAMLEAMCADPTPYDEIRAAARQ